MGPDKGTKARGEGRTQSVCDQSVLLGKDLVGMVGDP